ncbi:MAG: hypothetical protein QXQ90_05840 [Desulfurococcaceae archaeon]
MSQAVEPRMRENLFVYRGPATRVVSRLINTLLNLWTSCCYCYNLVAQLVVPGHYLHVTRENQPRLSLVSSDFSRELFSIEIHGSETMHVHASVPLEQVEEVLFSRLPSVLESFAYAVLTLDVKNLVLNDWARGTAMWINNNIPTVMNSDVYNRAVSFLSRGYELIVETPSELFEEYNDVQSRYTEGWSRIKVVKPVFTHGRYLVEATVDVFYPSIEVHVYTGPSVYSKVSFVLNVNYQYIRLYTFVVPPVSIEDFERIRSDLCALLRRAVEVAKRFAYARGEPVFLRGLVFLSKVIDIVEQNMCAR